MILSDLLGVRVRVGVTPTGGHAGDLGWVTDARFVLDPPSADQPMPTARLLGLIVSPYARSSSLGFERTDVRAPRLIAAFVRHRHRGSFLVRWADIAMISAQEVVLRPGYARHSALLPTAAHERPS